MAKDARKAAQGAPTSERERVLLGVLSALSGTCLLLLPDKMASLYGLPRGRSLARALGVRDIAIGLELCAQSGSMRASLLRSMSDALDAGLIAGEALHHGKLQGMAKLRVAGATLLAVYALALARTPARAA
jgi:hypothetical protein